MVRRIISLQASLMCRSKSYGCLAMRSAVFIKFLPAKAAQCRSIVVDFLIRSTGKSDLRGDLAGKLPLLKPSVERTSRYVSLNCLTTHYAPLWSEVFTPDFTHQRWSQPDNPRLPQDFF